MPITARHDPPRAPPHPSHSAVTNDTASVAAIRSDAPVRDPQRPASTLVAGLAKLAYCVVLAAGAWARTPLTSQLNRCEDFGFEEYTLKVLSAISAPLRVLTAMGSKPSMLVRTMVRESVLVRRSKPAGSEIEVSPLVS